MKPTQKVKRLAMNPLLSLLAGWKIKLPIAFVGGWILNRIVDAGELYAQAFGANPGLMLITATVVFADLAAGVYRARREKVRISSGRMRATAWKIIEYASAVLVCLLVSEAIRNCFLPDALAIWGEAAMIYIIITEGISCIENLLGEEEAGKLLGGMQNLSGQGLGLPDEPPTEKEAEA